MRFDPTRRSALKQSGLALASAAAALVPRELSAQSNSASTLHSAILDVRAYGATGDGKTIDSPAINRAIDAAAPLEEAPFYFLPEPICRFRSVCAVTYSFASSPAL